MMKKYIGIKKLTILVLLLFPILFSGTNGCDSIDAVNDPEAVDNGFLDQDVVDLNTGVRATQGAASQGDVYLVGAGIYDITGPAAEIGMGGFADDTQKTAGISLRLRSRAFVIGDGKKRVVFVNTDLWAMSQMVALHVAKKIAADPVLSKYYSIKNICLSATHTHNSHAGFDGYFLYDVPPKGFIRDCFNVVVDGIFNSIVLAHNNLETGKILINKGTLDKCGWNRSPSMYENNPSWEKALYNSNTDKTMTLLKLVNLEGEPVGMINWFAVHPDSIGPENKLISGDNKGHAAYMFEKDMGTDYQSSRTFVAAFAQTNAGDVTPNVPFTEHFGTVESAMDAAGVDRTTAESLGLPWFQALGEADIQKNICLRVIATRQYAKAKELFNSATEELKGSVDFRHEWVDMRKLYVEEVAAKTCPGGMGASYSYGSPADNPSPYPLFGEGVTTDSIDWSEDFETAFLSTFLPWAIGLVYPATVTDEYRSCHEPKPVILASGLMSLNLAKWIPLTPQIIPLQVLKVGGVAIGAVPTEVTTMAGRRIKNSLLDSLGNSGVKYSVVAALSNTYASYMATKEEYQLQGYEGGGTFFGPNQLLGFQQELEIMCDAISSGKDVNPGTAPADVTAYTVDLTTGVAFDDKPLSASFGSVYTQPAASYTRGDVASAVFWGGHPRNNLMTQKTYLEIVKIEPDGSSKIVARDWDPETKYRWARNGTAYSKITIEWDTANAAPGTYQIKHYGHWKSGWTGKIKAYSGVTKTFIVK